MRQRRIRRHELIAVRERIRRQIEDTHDDRADADFGEECITFGALLRAHRPFLSNADTRNDSS